MSAGDPVHDDELRAPPYSQLARLYDRVMSHVDYGAWASYLEIVFRQHGLPGSRVLELACGTCSLAALLAEDGYRIVGIDRSSQMLMVGRDKFRRLGLAPQFVAASMTDLPFDSHFDAVICMYDSLNYLLREDEVRRAAAEMARVTVPGGLVVFDVCTVRNSELFFSNGRMTEVAHGVPYERICRFDSTTRIQENIFRFTGGGGTEHHRQKIYYLEEIATCFDGLPFAEEGRYDDMTLRAGSESSERVHFVFRRI